MNLYLDALSVEAMHYSKQPIQNIYIGGGTPTTLDEVQLRRLFAMVNQNFIVAPNAEVTIECNPEGLTTEKLKCLLSCGVTRISLGIQTFNDQYLKYLGRIHDSQGALDAYDMIQQAGFKNINCDLMFGFPDQSDSALNLDIDQILSLQSQHVSLYSLTIDPKSRFYVQKISIDDHRQAEQYQVIMKRLNSAGFVHYEVSNFAKRGYESRHNMNYWKLGDYIGLGVGAHSYCKGERFSNTENFQEYLSSTGDAEHMAIKVHSSKLSPQEVLAEAVIFGLRMRAGIDLSALEQRFECSLNQSRKDIIDNLIKDGLLIRKYEILRVSDSGLMVLDEIAARLI